MKTPRNRIADRSTDLALRAMIRLALLLPYRWRVPLFGWVAAHLVAPLAGYRRRIRANLAHVLPDLPQAEIRRLCREVPDNVGRTVIEFYSIEAFAERMRSAEIRGPGLAALQAAQAAGKPAILVSGHFGNYQAVRVALRERGWTVAGLYRPMNNPYFNRHYVETTAQLGKPLFARDRRGMAGLVKHLREGGVTGILIDQYFGQGADVSFFGKTAPTATSVAEMALKYDAALIPAYGIRQPDGISIEIALEEPVAHTDAVTMTQACNDSLEAQVRRHMGQWFWVHRRWKPHRQRRRAAPSIRPTPSD